ncbi:E1B large T-antigen [Mastadenovirus eidoli]|uniref:E1B 55 kDa protein n=1 Tax=Eidolon helvum adenovirus TaxID=2039267 RepID=A0A348FKF6_9ADEN|nr:E1B large T-antigen [Eidolon helvum adenovirus]BBF72823.1 E1B large T-antigen [Eidolon helvum adenovirus]
MGDLIEEVADIPVENIPPNQDAGEGDGRAQQELALMLAERFLVRVSFGSIQYSELLDRVNADPYNALRVSVNFEVVKYWHFKPGDNWEDKIGTFAKLNLDPRYTYELDLLTYVRTDLYVNGNGATIMFKPGGRFEIKKKGLAPTIFGMQRATFFNCKFVAAVDYTGTPFINSRALLFLNCHFRDFKGNTIESYDNLHVRGCFFSDCTTCVRGLSANDYVSIRASMFAHCQLGAITKGKLKILNSYFDTCRCAAIFTAGGMFMSNTVTHSILEDTERQVTVTCAEGKVLPLQSVHVASNRKCLWPIFESNVFFRCRMYFGTRKGLLFAPNCQFRSCFLFLEREICSRVVFQQSYNQDAKIYKVLRLETNRTYQRMCECGEMHRVFPFLYGSITNSKLSADLLSSVDSLDFTSDEEGWYIWAGLV